MLFPRKVRVRILVPLKSDVFFKLAHEPLKLRLSGTKFPRGTLAPQFNP